MAPSTSTVTLIFPWPHFQAVQDGQPLIGGRLYTYAPESSTPKATFRDPGLITPQTNPVVLNDQGAAYIYLNGYYHLRLTDPEDVLIWEVWNYTFETGLTPGEGGVLTGSSDATVSALPGEGVIAVPGLCPVGYRCIGVTSTITEAWGASSGLTGFFIGDQLLLDRWGAPASLALGEKTNQLQFHSGDMPIAAPAGYVILLSAIGGLYDSNGEIHLTCYYESLPVDTP